jgi:hypothetical protein
VTSKVPTQVAGGWVIRERRMAHVNTYGLTLTAATILSMMIFQSASWC